MDSDTGPEGHDTSNQVCNNINEDIDNLIRDNFEDDFRRRTLTVRLRGGLELKPEATAIEINRSYQYEFLDKRQSLLLLTFHSREAADAAANKTIVIQGIRLTLDQPSVFETQLLHLFGIPHRHGDGCGGGVLEEQRVCPN